MENTVCNDEGTRLKKQRACVRRKFCQMLKLEKLYSDRRIESYRKKRKLVVFRVNIVYNYVFSIVIGRVPNEACRDNLISPIPPKLATNSIQKV